MYFLIHNNFPLVFSASRGNVPMDLGQLRVWKGAYGAPSLEPTSLQALAYVNFNAVSVKIIYGLVPQWAPIPRYKNSNGQYEAAVDIMQAVKVLVRSAIIHKYNFPNLHF